jgi:high affinity sulfate transporter 1
MMNPDPRPDGRNDHGPSSRPWEHWLPGLETIRSYRRSWLANDLAAGLVLMAVLVPAGMGYAQAAGLPAIYGLYATIVPLLAYSLFGPSRILVLGPDSSLAALIAATVLPLAANSPDRAVELAGMLAILSGAVSIVAGLARFGFITELLSKPIRHGYINGIAITVLVGQLPALLGFKSAGDGFLMRVKGLIDGIRGGEVNGTAVAISAACLAVILGCRRWLPRVPGVLPAVVGATLVVGLFDLDERAGLAVLGPLERGLPKFDLPHVTWNETRALIVGALAIALVSFADTSVLARIYAQRGKYEFRADQELIALGVANVATGLFQGFSVSASSSRTPVAESAGARSQLAPVVGALGIVLLLVLAPTSLQSLPRAALAAVVIAACLKLIEIGEVVYLFRVRPSEFVFSIVCLLGVILLDVVQGIFIAVGLALLSFIWRAWRPYDAVLGRVDGLKGYHDVTRYPHARRIPGLVLFRWDAPLFFANASTFQEHVLKAVRESPAQTKWVVVAAEPVTDVDVTSAEMLAELDEKLQDMEMDLVFAEMKDPVKDRLKRYGLFKTLGAESFFPTVGQAVDAYVERHQVEWTDWEERGAQKT